jgi:hypothetical protein
MINTIVKDQSPEYASLQQVKIVHVRRISLGALLQKVFLKTCTGQLTDFGSVQISISLIQAIPAQKDTIANTSIPLVKCGLK